jgi:tRNA threonylcarbamoyladenosine modification (KEOPS) complex  Pcc1 subunit
MSSPDTPVLATVTIDLNEKMIKVIETALTPETDTPSSDRSETSVTLRDNQLVIQTHASDTTALRASLNSYLRWVDGIQNILMDI